MSIIALLDPGMKVGFEIHQLLKLNLDQMGIFSLFGIIALVQLYKVCILLRKDVRSLFIDSPEPENPPLLPESQPEDL